MSRKKATVASSGSLINPIVDRFGFLQAYRLKISGQSLGEDLASSGEETELQTELEASKGRAEGEAKKAERKTQETGQSDPSTHDYGSSQTPADPPPYDGPTLSSSGVKDPGEDQGVSPEQLGLAGWKQMTPGLFRTPTGGKGGDVDPAEDAESKGQIINDPQIHLSDMGKFGLIGQPDTTQDLGGGGGFTGSPQSGGDIDMGPDSPQQGYTGPTRTEDPADVDTNVNAAPLIGLGSKSKDEEEEQDKGTKKTTSPFPKK